MDGTGSDWPSHPAACPLNDSEPFGESSTAGNTSGGSCGYMVVRRSSGEKTIEWKVDISGWWGRHVLLVLLVVTQGCGHTQLVQGSWPEPDGPNPAQEAKLHQEVRQGKAESQTYAELAFLRLAAGDPHGGRDYALQGLSRASSHVSSLVALARAQTQLKLLLEASNTYQKIVQEVGTLSSRLLNAWSGVLIERGEQAVSQQHAMNLEQVVLALGHDRFRGSAVSRKKGLNFAVSLLSIYLRQKNHSKAEVTLERAQKLGLSDEEELFVRGKMAALKGRFKQGKGLFSRWVESNPSSKRWLRVANYFRSIYRIKEALWAYRKGIKSYPESEEGWRRLGHMLVLAREPDEAVSAWQRVAELARSRGEEASLSLRLEGAQSLRQAGYSEYALRIYSDLLKGQGSTHPRVVEAYGDYLLQLGRAQELVALVQRYAGDQLQSPEAKSNPAEVAKKVIKAVDLVKKSGRIQNAVEIVASLKDLGATGVDVCLFAAQLEEEQSNPQARNATMARCTVQAGAHASTLLRIAQAWLEFDRPIEAMKLTDAVLAKRPASVNAALVRANALYKQRQRLRASIFLEDFLQARGFIPDVAVKIAAFYGQREEWQRVERLLVASLDKHRARAGARLHRELAWLYVQSETWNEAKAMAHLRSWMAETQDEAEVEILTRFRRSALRGPKALRLRRLLLERLTSLRPKDDKLRMRLGEIQLLLGEFSAARKTFENVLRESHVNPNAVERVVSAFLKAGEEGHAYFFLKMISPSSIAGDGLLIALGHMYEERKLISKATECYELFVARAARTDQDRSRLEKFAKRMLTQARYKLAINAFNVLAERKPRSKATFEGLGRALLASGQILSARAVFERYLGEERGAKLTSALNRLADIYLEFGLTKEAARLLEEKLSRERDRWQAPSFSRLCALYREHGDKASIQRITKVFLSRGFNRGRAVEIAARELDRSGLTPDAFRLVKATLKTKGRRIRNRRVLMRRAIHYAAVLGDDKEMLTFARAYAKSRGGQQIAWTEAAGFLQEQHRPALAVRLMDEAMKRWPTNAALQVSRGHYLLELGRKDAATRDFTEALAKSTSVPSTMKEIRQVLGTSMHQALLAEMEKLARVFQPGRADGYLTLGAVLAASGDLTAAKRAFTRYLDKNPRGHLKVARAFGSHQVEEALRHYRNADLRVTSVGLQVLQEVATLLVDHGDADRMRVFVRRFLLQAENPPAGFEAISKIWLVLGKPLEAAQWLERAIEQGPNPVRYRRLGKIYAGLGEGEKALNAFTHYVSALPLRPSGRRASFRETQSYENAVLEVLGFYLDRTAFQFGRRFLTHLEATDGLLPFLIACRAELMIREGRAQDALVLLEQHAKQLEGIAPRHVERLVRSLGAALLYSEALAVMEATRTGRSPGTLGRIRLRFMSRLGRANELERAVAQQVLGASAETELNVALLLFVEGEFGAASRLLESYLNRGVIHRRAEAKRALETARKGLSSAHAVHGTEGAGLTRQSPFREAADRALANQMERRYDAAMKAAYDALSYKPDDSDMVRVALHAGLLSENSESLKTWVKERVQFELKHAESSVNKLKIVRLLERSYAPVLESVAWEAIHEHTGFRPKVVRRLLRAHLRAGAREAADRITAELLRRTGDPSLELSRVVTIYLDEGHAQALTHLLDRESQKAGIDDSERLLHRLKVMLALERPKEVRHLVEALSSSPSRSSRILRLAALANESYRGPAELTARLLSNPVFRGKPSEEALRLKLRSLWRAGSLDQAHDTLRALLKRFPPTSSNGLRYYTDLLRECVWAADSHGLEELVSLLEVRTSDSLVSIVGVVSGLIHDAPEDSAFYRKPKFLAVVEGLIEQAEEHGLDEQQLVSARTYLQEARGDMESAVGVQEASRERERSTPTSLNNLAYLYARTGKRLNEGFVLVQEAIARTLFVQPSYADTKAWLLHKMGRSEEAYQHMKEALHMTDWSRAGYGHSELLFHYAELLRATERKEVAVRALRDCARYRYKSRYGRRCAERLKQAGDREP